MGPDHAPGRGLAQSTQISQTRDVSDVEDRKERIRALGQRVRDGEAALDELRRELPELRALDPSTYGPKALEYLTGGAVDRATISRWTAKAAGRRKQSAAA